MDLIGHSWRLMVRSVGAISRRLLHKEFDELMATGCDLVYRFEGSDAVSLTFDDGPTPHSTREILSVLDQYGVRSTFFCIGNHAAAHPELVREIALRGHEVANHTQTHIDLHRVFPCKLRREVVAGHRTLSGITGRAIVSFRAPFGHFRWDLRNISGLSGERILVHFDVAPPYFETNPSVISEYILHRIRMGSIVLLHDGLAGADNALSTAVGNASATCLHTVIPTLIERGFKFRTVSEQWELAQSTEISLSPGVVP